jgi:hypothetical protein
LGVVAEFVKITTQSPILMARFTVAVVEAANTFGVGDVNPPLKMVELNVEKTPAAPDTLPEKVPPTPDMLPEKAPPTAWIFAAAVAEPK